MTTLIRLPFTVYRSQFTVYRRPFTVDRSPSTVHRRPFTVDRSPSTVHRRPFTVDRSPSTVLPHATSDFLRDVGLVRLLGLFDSSTLRPSTFDSRPSTLFDSFRLFRLSPVPHPHPIPPAVRHTSHPPSHRRGRRRAARASCSRRLRPRCVVHRARARPTRHHASDEGDRLSRAAAAQRFRRSAE